MAIRLPPDHTWRIDPLPCLRRNRNETMRMLTHCLVALGWLTLSGGVFAQESLEKIEAKAVKKVATQFAEQVQKFDKPQVKISPDITTANGVHKPEKAGVLVIPQKGLTAQSLAKAAKTKEGAGVGFLFCHHLAPAINGQAVAKDQLRSVSFAGDDGGEIEISCMLLVVRELPDKGLRLFVYCKGPKPLLSAKLSKSAGPGIKPLAVEVKDIEAETGTLTLTLFDTHQAGFKVMHQP